MRVSIRTNQGGSVLTFVIIGLVLLSALGGGLYYVSRYGQNATNTTELSTPVVETKDSQVATDEEADSSGATDTTTDNSSSTGTTESTESNTSDVGALPQTGPSSMIIASIGLASVTFAGMSYLNSRRMLGYRR